MNDLRFFPGDWENCCGRVMVHSSRCLPRLCSRFLCGLTELTATNAFSYSTSPVNQAKVHHLISFKRQGLVFSGQLFSGETSENCSEEEVYCADPPFRGHVFE